MNPNERRAVRAWDEWVERPAKPQRPKLPVEYRADYRAYGARGWVGMDGKRYDCRDSWEESIRFKGIHAMNEQEASVSVRAKFWSDDFDMDLLKILPSTGPLLAKIERPLYVHGGESFGRLNHPCVWNSDGGFVAFFSFKPNVPHKPPTYWVSSPIRECTWAEAVRDWWVHHYTLTVDGRTVLPGNLWPEFQTLMYALRGWGKPKPEAMLAAIRRKCENVIFEGTVSAERIGKRV